MALKANQILVNTVACRQAYEAHPEKARLMEPEMKNTLFTLTDELIPLLHLIGSSPALEDIEKAYEDTHHKLKQMHYGLRWRYIDHPDQLEGLGSLTLSANPEKDRVHFAAIVAKINGLKPKFVWLPELQLSDLETTLDNHGKAAAKEEALGPAVPSANKRLRELREPCRKLWEGDHGDGGLTAWIKAHIKGTEAQQAWGLEPHHRSRAAKTDEQQKPPAGKPKSKTKDQRPPTPPQNGQPAAAGDDPQSSAPPPPLDLPTAPPPPQS